MEKLKLFAKDKEIADYIKRVKEKEYQIASDTTSVISDYLKKCPGKHIRSTFFYLITKMVDNDIVVQVDIGAALELFHTATLFHDDVIDESVVRRGRPTLNSMFSSKFSILAGDLLICSALDLMRSSKSWKLMKIFANLGKDLTKGELCENDIWIADNDSKYFNQIYLKTGTFFESIAKIGAIAGGANQKLFEAISNYGTIFGKFFQVLDDYKDYFWPQSKTGKAQGADFINGVVTLPLMRLYHFSDTHQKRLITSYFNKPSKENFGIILKMMRELYIDKKIEAELSQMINSAIIFLEEFPDSKYKDYLRYMFTIDFSRTAC